MAGENTPITMFSHFQKFLEADQEIREEIRKSVKELDQNSREIQAHIQLLHHNANKEGINELCSTVQQKLPLIVEQLNTLKEKVPKGEYYRFHDHWRVVIQRVVSICTLVHYLQTDQLIPNQLLSKNLNLEDEKELGFHLDLDDYLIGVLQTASELSRLCTNSVIAGDFARPFQIARFLCSLDGAFRLLNLKNDALRKRFDGLKYDLKKVEEIVYDLSVRGLVKSE